MLDLETLDTRPRAKILSVGALAFDPHGTTLAADAPSFYGVVDAVSYGADEPFTEDAATRAWWDRQGADARAEVFDNPAARPWRDVVADVVAWLRAQASAGRQPLYVWANSPAFDCTILANAIQCAGHAQPWRYYAQRDVRSLGALAGLRYTTFRDMREASGATDVAHHALADCRMQARFTQHAIRALGRPAAPTSEACVLYTGPMYAGKTDALIAHLQYARTAARRRSGGQGEPLVLKHVNDAARRGDRLASRTGRAWDGPVHALVSLDRVFEDRALTGALDRALLVAVDEAQFFAPRELRAFVRTCLARAVPVVLSGLSAVADATAWPAIAAVQPFVTRTVHLRATCAGCGTPDAATLTHRATALPADGDPVFVASARQEDAVYRPLCVACYARAPAAPGGTGGSDSK